MRIERVEDELVHAPATTGVRFSGGDMTDVRGGKSMDWRVAGELCRTWDKMVSPFLPGEILVVLLIG
jgi:hypothetical protein